jgi:hypothetical protein
LRIGIVLRVADLNRSAKKRRRMKVYFGQIYIEVGASFRFSHQLQLRLSDEVTAAIQESADFAKAFGADWSLMFRISAKRKIEQAEILGPTVFRKAKDVEFSVFLPFNPLSREADVERAALAMLLGAVCEKLERYSISTVTLRERASGLIDSICSDSGMFMPSVAT